MEIMKVFKGLTMIVFLLSSCTSDVSINNRKELHAYIDLHKAEFIKERKFESFVIFSKFIPSELYLKRKDRAENQSLTFNFQLISPYQDFLKKYCESYDEYRKYKWYLTNEATKFIYLEQKEKKIHPDLAQLEEQYELSRGCSFNIVFDANKIDLKEPITLVYNDELFGMGKLKFRYNTKLITNLPIHTENYNNALL